MVSILYADVMEITEVAEYSFGTTFGRVSSYKVPLRARIGSD